MRRRLAQSLLGTTLLAAAASYPVSADPGATISRTDTLLSRRKRLERAIADTPVANSNGTANREVGVLIERLRSLEREIGALLSEQQRHEQVQEDDGFRAGFLVGWYAPCHQTL